MRGVVTVVAAQTLPAGTPQRNLLVLVAFVVAAVSLLVQGGTLGLVVRWLRPVTVDPAAAAAEREELSRRLRAAGRAELAAAPADPELRAAFEEVLSRIRVAKDSEGPERERLDRVRWQALAAQRAELMRLRDDGEFSSEALGHALAVLDAQQLMMELQEEADRGGGVDS